MQSHRMEPAVLPRQFCHQSQLHVVGRKTMVRAKRVDRAVDTPLPRLQDVFAQMVWRRSGGQSDHAPRVWSRNAILVGEHKLVFVAPVVAIVVDLHPPTRADDRAQIRPATLDTLRGYVRRVDLFKEHTGAAFP
jgi:hypothetical protein